MRLNFKRLGLLGAHLARTLTRLADLTPARVDVMTLLQEQARIQREIAAILCVSEGVVSRLITALEEAGLVVRTVPLRDRRVRLVSLTEEGRARLALMMDEYTGLEPGGESAQCTGERFWAVHWESVVYALRLDPVFAIYDSLTPPYRAMQRRARLGVYRSLVGALSKSVSEEDLGASCPSGERSRGRCWGAIAGGYIE